MNWKLILALACSLTGSCFALWCLIVTHSISMTLFFTLGLPLQGLGAGLLLWEILLDLRRHQVL